jgi:hypothetical protein
MAVGPRTKVVIDLTDVELRAEVENLTAQLRAIHVDLDAVSRLPPNDGTNAKIDELKEDRQFLWDALEYALAEIKRREQNKLQQSANQLLQKYVELTGNYVKLTKWIVVAASLSVVVAILSIVVTLLTSWFRR